MRSGKRRTLALCGVLLLAGCSSWTPLRTPTPVDAGPLTPVAQRSAAAVGRLLSTRCSGAPAAGTGFVVGPGLVLTAAHVVGGARQVSVRLTGAGPVPAEIVGIDASRDTALVRAGALPGDPPTIPLASDRAATGTTVVALGYPLGESVLHRTFARITSVTDSALVNGSPMRDLVTLDATLPVGLSGGPALDADGVARGMVVAAIGGRGGRDSTSPVTLALPASGLQASLTEWGDDTAVPSAPCAGEVDHGEAADPDLIVSTTDADAPELAHTLWLLGRSINAGQYPSAAGMLTRGLLAAEGGVTAWGRGLDSTRWQAIDLRSATRDGDRATARARLRTADDDGCRVQPVEVRFERSSGIWLVAAVEQDGAAEGC
ncbi:MAG: trypsin-like peptidase domain-containing protein [Propionibacteriaceae bacterium]|nr:trypsin-like peptidase domain-containing protein [Propionibacteriaceae bacterium]